MKLPAAHLALVDPAKIRDYLLSPEHLVGRHKASFFHALGYSRRDWPRLEDGFRRLIASQDAVPGNASEFGTKYEVRGSLEGPAGRRAEVVTVWIIRTGETVPRFVTAFPGAKP